jgi:1-acyl-sn-glycerol-3-phosphate acyltransferase
MRICFCYFIKYSILLFFRIFYRLRIYGKEHFVEGGAIVAANHTSFYDPPIVGVSVPKEIHFLARDSLFSNSVFGAAIRALNAHPLAGDAGDMHILRAVVSLLSQGKKVILFPEGTRQEKDEFGEIKPGIGLLVAKSRTAIIPAYIDGAYSVWNRFRKSPKPFGKVMCVFGKAILWDDYADLGRKQAQAAMTEQLASSWNDLRAWVRAGAKGSPP